MAAVELRPGAALAPFVARMGRYRGDHPPGRELSLPTGAVQLTVNLAEDALSRWGAAPMRVGGAGFVGPSGGPAVIDPAQQRDTVWVLFRAGGAAAFLPGGAHELRDGLVDLADVWGRDGATLRERLLSAADPVRALERVLTGRLLRGPDPALVAAARALHDGASVAATADRLGWTTRHLGRRFAAGIGLAPKRFGRVRRFQRLLRAVTAGGAPDWARLAVECGYYDQAHLVNEFRDLSGLTPGAYRPRDPAARNHVPLSPIPPEGSGRSSEA
ncbi:AraC family transcriptional regulator [Virgisporangium aliadipatigenens]|uniref:AraC family transcriptional regulator n=1 Tax=Virgisporangium aliadipatigenens TaxID=741659 RepID=A0A8J3YLI5_9ACTN|nr:AraC family transcriptional regulator [Virgisporangium aliadipatigenens]GIJ46323.1 AraC family transcriptional regulator [Virgisporangium aliadipatigenens]